MLRRHEIGVHACPRMDPARGAGRGVGDQACSNLYRAGTAMAVPHYFMSNSNLGISAITTQYGHSKLLATRPGD